MRAQRLRPVYKRHDACALPGTVHYSCNVGGCGHCAVEYFYHCSACGAHVPYDGDPSHDTHICTSNIDRTPCTTKHDNPYCATSEPKILVDVEHERARAASLATALDRHDFQDNGTDKRRHQRQATRDAMADSQDHIRAVEMGCALPEPKTPCPEAFFVDGVCENCGAIFGSDVAHGSQL